VESSKSSTTTAATVQARTIAIPPVVTAREIVESQVPQSRSRSGPNSPSFFYIPRSFTSWSPRSWGLGQVRLTHRGFRDWVLRGQGQAKGPAGQSEDHTMCESPQWRRRSGGYVKQHHTRPQVVSGRSLQCPARHQWRLEYKVKIAPVPAKAPPVKAVTAKAAPDPAKASHVPGARK